MIRKISLLRHLGLMLAASVALAANPPVAQRETPSEIPKAWGDWPRWGDQGDGTYRNPVLPSDYSDLDCIRVGEDYYAISSTMQFSPGMVILHSKDLVNWTIAGHAITDLTQIGPELNWDRMNRYGKGVWAGAIRHAKGRFWIYFGTPDEGYFMTSAPSPTGPWEPLHPLMKSRGWDDCCPFWDDDGQGYFVGTCFADGYKTYLWKLTPDDKGLIEESRTLINEGAKREASKLFKINGWYYHMFSEVTDGARVVTMQRSRNILGPYTERRQLTALNRESHEPNQGGMVDTVNGDWFFFTHHGRGDWEGRPASLLPVTWVDGWPILGETDAAGKPGLMSWGGKKLLADNIATPQSSDDFGSVKLAEQWEWNHQPRADMWSLTERPGFLRLHAFRPLRPDDLMKAGNTLTQRSFRTASNCVVLKLDLSGLADGQKAGLCHFAGTHSALGVVQDGKIRRIEYRENGKLTAGPEITGDQLWLKSTWGFDGHSRYAYSPDGISFTDFGPEYQLSWGNYRGDRIGIYNFNTKQDAGCVDVDFVSYDYTGVSARDAKLPPDDFGHALIPDLLADPSIVDLDGTFYCYATTDGAGKGLATSGTPVVWKSRDFLNWSFHGSSFPPGFDAKYWAPSSLIRKDGRYYSYPTLDGKITAVIADSPAGPFRAVDGREINKQSGWPPFPIEQKSSIDAEVFVDDDGQAYMVWSRRRMMKLNPDLLSPDGPQIEISTKRAGYSEGPFLFKRNGIYYYLYTLGGHENYQYAYMMSRKSPLGSWEAPEQDIIAMTDHEEKVFGPGHGCFFHPQGGEQWYFVYLEYGRGGTTRQIFADKMSFNADGTIQPVKLTKAGVGALRPVADQSPNLALGKTAAASSTIPDFKVAPRADKSLARTETYLPVNALDGSNGSRWLAAGNDSAPWWQLDLGSVHEIKRTEIYFVQPTAGHAYKLEVSLDAKTWQPYGGHEDVILQSPHTDTRTARVRYLRLAILKGTPGLWEFRVY